jgi:hypothetical protein
MPTNMDAAAREVSDRVMLHPVPPPGFDPMTADAISLSRYGLPPRPDPGLEPGLFDAFARMYGRPLRWVTSPRVSVDLSTRHELLRAPGAVGLSRQGSSENWSGALIAARDGQRFTDVTGTWRVPAPGAPEGASVNNLPPAGSWRCSVWIGLDGHLGYSDSLPQIGTTSVLEPVAIEQKGGSPPVVELRPRCYAWAQWWVRGRPWGEVPLGELPVAPGDEMTAWLRVEAPDRVVMGLTNGSQNVAEAHRTWAAGLIQKDPKGGDRSMAPVAGHSAQWIVETPLTMPDAVPPLTPYDLPDYGAVPFTGCTASMRDSPAASGPATPRDLTGARLLRMVAPREGPPRSAVTSVPDPIAPDRASFVTRYRA